MSSIVEPTATLLPKDLLAEDQLEAIDRLYCHDATLLIANMGAGKTIIALTAVQDLIDDEVLEHVVVFAPLKVCQEQWQQEAEKWAHIDIDVVFCEGVPVKRLKTVEAFEQEGRGILLVNFENMAWFCDTFPNFGDGLLVDELSKLKAGGKGFKRLRRTLEHYTWRAGMTGTPVAEDFEGLFYQVLTLDSGARLGRNKTKFLEKYFTPDYNGYDWHLRDGEGIVDKIKDLVYTVPDYSHELPPLYEHVVLCDMPLAAMDTYKTFERDGVIELGGHVQMAENPAVLTGKLQQMASGRMYIEDEWGERLGTHELHNSKADTLISMVPNEPVIIAYQYKHELATLERLFPDATNLSEKGAIDRWNRGEIRVLLVQPQSCSHGIQLQHGGRNLIFYGLTWSNDIRRQMIARLWRRGQKLAVRVWELVSAGTIDEQIVDRVAGKTKWDARLHALLQGKKRVENEP